MESIVLEGAVDLHCHYGPESVVKVPHAVDPVEAASDASALGMAGLVLKSHDFPSNTAAYLARQAVDGIAIFGSVCCDYCIGGLNPGAVETALRDGAAIVWLPTISSRQDVENGVAQLLDVPGPPISLLGEDGRLVAEVHEICDLAAEHGAVVATGHTTADEHLAVCRAFAPRQAVVVTHAMNAGAGPKLSVGQCVELAELGGYIELSAATCMAGHGPSVAEVVDAIVSIGPDRVVLSTDYGWSRDLPRPAPGFRSYVDALWRAGAPERDLRRMACRTPARLVGLDP